MREDDAPNSDSVQKTGSRLGMSRETMLQLARQTSELLVDWNTQLRDKDAWDGDFQQALEAVLEADPPEQGRPGGEVVEQVTREILPVAARHQHPRFFAFVPSSITWPGVLADFLASGYNINACTWLSASGPSQVELLVLDWFRRWLGYPASAGGIFTSGGSAASLDALVAAREAAGNPERASVYMSDQTHLGVARAARIIGVAAENVRQIRCDSRARIDVEVLAETLAQDRAAGLHPIAVCANAGTASSGAIDPLETLADLCEAQGIWLHVDGAYGGFAVLAEEGRRLLRGIERADSVSLDAHKWLFQPYEAGCLMVKDLSTLDNAFELRTDVLQDTIWGANHPNLANRGLQLSRSFRALKVWMSIQTFGMEAFRHAVSHTLELANKAGSYVEARPTLELLTPVSLGILCFRVVPQDAAGDEQALEGINRAVLARIFWDEPALISSTTLGGAFSLRLCILNHETTWDDVRETLDAAERFGTEEMSRRMPAQSSSGRSSANQG